MKELMPAPCDNLLKKLQAWPYPHVTIFVVDSMLVQTIFSKLDDQRWSSECAFECKF